MIINPVNIDILVKLICYAILFLALTVWVILDLFQHLGERITTKEHVKIAIIAITANMTIVCLIGVWYKL